MMQGLIIRDSTEADIPSVRSIYAYYVQESFASLEEDPPAFEEMLRRRSDVLACGLPHIVAETEGGEIVGYSYPVPYRTRSAYRFPRENSVYVNNGLVALGSGNTFLST